MKPLLLAAVLVPLTIAPADARSIRTLEGHYEANGIRTIRLEAAPGDVHVEPSRDGRVHVFLDVRCDDDSWDDCAGRARAIRLTSDPEGSVLRVEVLGMEHRDNRGLNVNARVQMPADRAFELHMLAGDIDVRGLRNDIDVDMLAGDVKVTMDEDDIRSLRANVTIGDATLWTGDDRIDGEGRLGKRLHWSRGRGDAHVNVGLRFGDIDVRLR